MKAITGENADAMRAMLEGANPAQLTAMQATLQSALRQTGNTAVETGQKV